MNSFAIESSADDSALQGDDERPFLEVEGVEGSSLRATISGLVIRAVPGSALITERSWGYDQLGSVRLDAYGPIGVIRATILPTGNDLPLLLLEPDQIIAARRGLEMVWNLMGARQASGQPA